MTTIGLVANVYNEVNALPGWLECHTPYFDDIRIMHAGPGGVYSDDGTIELLEKWKVPVEFCAIDDGFGVVRTKTLHMSPCDYVMLLDADERFFPVHRVAACTGDITPHSKVDAILSTYNFGDLKNNPPNWDNVARLGAKLRVDIGAPYDQGARLREIIAGGTLDAVATVRRHWHDFTFRRPTQNWHIDPDWQMRLVRNSDSIRFDSSTRMHERLVGAVNVFHADQIRGPFFDHFHFTFKRMEMEQRAHDIAVYNAIHEGRTPPTQEEFNNERTDTAQTSSG